MNPLPVDQALAFVLEILPAFAYLHDLNLIFCDFKPDNMIQQGDGVKLIDLGGVRRLDDMTSAIFGTVGYQAPRSPRSGPRSRPTSTRSGAPWPRSCWTSAATRRRTSPRCPGRRDTGLPAVRLLLPAARQGVRARPVRPVRDDRRDARPAHRRAARGRRDRPRAGSGALHSAASVLFEAPCPTTRTPLTWDALPALKVDDSDPMASWLAGVNIADPAARMAALAAAPEATVEVRLAYAKAAIEHRRFAEVDKTIAEMLAEDPWEWRAAWIGGLAELARGDAADARASFNAVYGQVPGELAPSSRSPSRARSAGSPTSPSLST
ncbi:tetratricopeptide repeat protein [Oerskovia sp. M15]